jgi:hypothetical protein
MSTIAAAVRWYLAQPKPCRCEVLLVPADLRMPANFMYVAYGPSGMACPTPADFVVIFGQFIDDRTGLEIGIPDHYGWGKGVTVGLVPIDNWTPR